MSSKKKFCVIWRQWVRTNFLFENLPHIFHADSATSELSKVYAINNALNCESVLATFIEILNFSQNKFQKFTYNDTAILEPICVAYFVETVLSTVSTKRHFCDY